ncbi:probable oxidoreductase (homolog to saccharopine dehydrogenase) [Natronomonas pharaonis DSM 2160]|uniref:Probable oxidoreductase (Homolog to saccharopine dehydrogenase) n=1 Tax=Natronomonas pharaonis (strain ATCC 35678 / DSM 2160 / CIP 103997 / JCM 8858 / NBRC 14720 / NCIMB 2260 / Gabara) TaxID=348780 RepID=A0A1U7EVS1_NATPD|nr:saccharopine dehydrogenase NADP-binding domain-containing protein [Natronomonas pharaonis]CAI49147.1 probable oxidoreductase (homolog to saccharopine dehydrogenase) [Natronomonas pharaonis DSM 2160]
MSLLIYGAYGYTGELIAEEAVDRDLDVVVAGRDKRKVRDLAARLNCKGRRFDLDAAADNLDDIEAVLNCAGPFVETYEPLVEACLETGTHYLDITGELSVFEAIAERDREAEKAGVCLLPGVGFDVVPTDCLAGHLHDMHPSADELRLGFDPSGTISKGTLASVIEHLDEGGKVRRDGRLVDVPPAHKRRYIDFGRGERSAATIPWGDVSTAYYTTGIENIEVYTAMPSEAAIALKYGSGIVSPVLGAEPVKGALQTLAKTVVSGPSEKQRREGVCYVWGEATDGERTVTARLKTPETYALTVDAATTAAARILDDAPAGFETPAAAFTPEFVLALDGVEGFF